MSSYSNSGLIFLFTVGARAVTCKEGELVVLLSQSIDLFDLSLSLSLSLYPPISVILDLHSGLFSLSSYRVFLHSSLVDNVCEPIWKLVMHRR